MEELNLQVRKNWGLDQYQILRAIEKDWRHKKWNRSAQERASRELNVQGQLQGSDPTVLQGKKQRCYKITCQLCREMMLFLLQTRVRFKQTSTTHLSAAIYNIVIITICPHCISPGVPHAAAEITGQEIRAPEPRSDKPQHLWEGEHEQKIPSRKA